MNEVIITIVDGKGFEEDFEIPAEIKLEKWIDQISGYLKPKYSIEEGYQLLLSYKDRKLNSDDTLTEMSVTDGSILTLEWRQIWQTEG